MPQGEGQVAIAARANNEGVDAFAAERFDEASAKFRDAVAREPEPIYFFHLCLALEREGKLAEAMTACDAVHDRSPPADLEARAGTERDRIRADAARQGIELHAP